MKKINIVKENREFNDVIQTGKFIKNKYFVIYYKNNNLNRYRFGISVSKKTCNAVNRNKLFNDIGNIRYKQNDNNLNLFIFDGENELTELYDIGQVISVPEMVEMLNDASRIVFDPAYIKRMKANKSNKVIIYSFSFIKINKMYYLALFI